MPSHVLVVQNWYCIFLPRPSRVDPDNVSVHRFFLIRKLGSFDARNLEVASVEAAELSSSRTAQPPSPNKVIPTVKSDVAAQDVDHANFAV